MKSLKLGVVAAVVLALGIVGGAGQASATSICAKNENPCLIPYKEKNVYTAKPVQDTLFLFNVNNRCTESEIVFETQKNLGKNMALTGEVTYVGFDKCTFCPVKAIHLPYKAEIKATKGGDGTLTMSNNTAGNPGVLQEKCGGAHLRIRERVGPLRFRRWNAGHSLASDRIHHPRQAEKFRLQMHGDHGMESRTQN